jgi:hypothetical protein
MFCSHCCSTLSFHQIAHSYLQCLTTFVLKGCKNRNSFKRIICFYLIKNSIFYEIIYCFQFTQRTIENRSTFHAWNACRRLPMPDIDLPTYVYVFSCRQPHARAQGSQLRGLQFKHGVPNRTHKTQ